MTFFRRLALAFALGVAWLGLAAAEADLSGPDAIRPLPTADRGLPRFRAFLPREYRGHEQIWDIAETSEGVMLFSYLNGIAEYDGQTWRTIPVPGGSYVRAMEADAHGVVWVGGDDEIGRLVKGEDGRLRYESLRAQVPAELGPLGPIWKLYARPDGVYFLSNRALLRWDGGRFEVWRVDSGRTAMAFPFADSILVCADFGWRLARPGGQWAQVGDAKDLAAWWPRFLFPREDGTWLAGTGARGVYVVRRDGSTEKFPTSVDDWFAQSRPYQGIELPDGRYLFTSIQGGMLITTAGFEPELLLDEAAGLKTQTVINAYVDRRGVLWLGTDRGMVRVELSSPLTVFSEVHGIGRGGLEGMERVDGRLYVNGTATVLGLRPPEKKYGLPQFEKVEGASERSTMLLRLPDGVFSGGLSGVTWFSQGKSEQIESPPGVREVQESRTQPGRFFGTHLNGLCSWRREDGKWIYEGDWKEPRGEIRGLVQDGQGRFWVSTANRGVLRITPERGTAAAARIETFADESGLIVDRGRVWLHDVAGAPLFSTNEGMFRFDEATQRFRREGAFGARFADGSSRTRLLTSDSRGGLWLGVESTESQPREIVYARDGAWERLALPGFADIGGLNFIICEKIDRHEILWIGGESELWQVDLARWRQQSASSPGHTLLREMMAGGKSHLAREASPQFAFNENTVRFVFATPGLAGESQPRHESRLRGFRDGEEVLSAANERTFTNLPAGDYVFEVRGLTDDGRWSEPATFGFSVLAPWWQTGLAWTVYVLAFGVSLFAYIRWRIRRLTRERTQLEAVVKERTAELARSNAELQRLHRVDQDEKLAARLAEEKAVLELLRYQLNPHFLFNSLNSIRALVYSSPDAAGEMVTRLSDFCRHTLTRSGDELTTVAQELEMTRTYLEIERARWQENLVTQVEVEPEAEHQVMPRFLFLPLIENAIKYGGRTSPGVLQVRVSVRLDGGFLRCEVANTGVWNAADDSHPKESTHIGLENMRRRLARHFGRAAALEIQPGDGWVRVCLRLPVITDYVPAAAAKAAAREEAEDA